MISNSSNQYIVYSIHQHTTDTGTLINAISQHIKAYSKPSALTADESRGSGTKLSMAGRQKITAYVKTQSV